MNLPAPQFNRVIKLSPERIIDREDARFSFKTDARSETGWRIIDILDHFVILIPGLITEHKKIGVLLKDKTIL